MAKKKIIFEKFIEDSVREIVNKSRLNDYDIYFILRKEKHLRDKHGEESTYAMIEVDQQYLTATIYLYPTVKELYNDCDYRKIREILTHEIAHIRIHKLVTLSKDRYTTEEQIDEEVEKLTEIMSRLIYKTTYE